MSSRLHPIIKTNTDRSSHTDLFMIIRKSFRKISKEDLSIGADIEKVNRIRILYREASELIGGLGLDIKKASDLINGLSITIFSDKDQRLPKITENISIKIKTTEKVMMTMRSIQIAGEKGLGMMEEIKKRFLTSLIEKATEYAIIQERIKGTIKTSKDAIPFMDEEKEYLLIKTEQDFDKETMKRLEKIDKDLKEVSSILQNMQILVEMQEEKVSMVGENVEDAYTRIDEGHEEVKSFKGRYKRKMKIIIILLMIIIIQFLIVVIKAN
eukprot:GHVP01001223.1.p1 GENE.GHVP01001223.1~~GHVP01001223.1.p1  ORF type:complete len:269 (-),score=58.71 GHVP01001223.1:682-1488(-)